MSYDENKALQKILDHLYKMALEHTYNNASAEEIVRDTGLSLRAVKEQGNNAIIHNWVIVDSRSDDGEWIIRIDASGIKKLKELEKQGSLKPSKTWKDKTLTSELVEIPKKRFQKLLLPPIILIVLCLIGVGLVHFDVVFVNDDKIIPFQRSYLFSNVVLEEGKELKELLVMNYFFDMNGTLQLHTTSRSAQNPIQISITLEPYNVEQSSPRPLSNAMPKTLKYVFPDALDVSVDPPVVTLPKEVIIELKQKVDPLRYEGNKKIKYEDPSSYDFYLLERAQMEKAINGSVTINYSFNIQNDERKIFMAELENTGNEKIRIGDFAQTLDAEERKSNWFKFFIATAFTSVIPIIAILVKDKRSSGS